MRTKTTLTPTEIIKRGKTVYRVFLGTINGKKKYRQFNTKVDADTFCYQANVENTAKIYKESIGEPRAPYSVVAVFQLSELD
jgi:hypothetical protein